MVSNIGIKGENIKFYIILTESAVCTANGSGMILPLYIRNCITRADFRPAKPEKPQFTTRK